MRHDWKNVPHLENWATIGKKVPHLKKMCRTWTIKAGVNIKAVFWLCITFLTQISRSRFKQSRISLLIPLIYVLGLFVNFLVIF